MTHPEKLGKYRVTGVLGEGAMGVVYKGFDPGIQRVVALKTVRRQLLESTEFGASMGLRFRNEAQAAGRLGHPGIVAVYDYGDEADVAYIAMEFVEGNTLERYIANKVHFGDSDIVSVLVQLLDALDHAHNQGVWHRDIKPANVLMTRDGRLKIADFGIARIESAALTQVSSVIGTPSHMAPEQFLGAEIDRRVDIYATGVLFYQLLVGKPPFMGSTESLTYRVVHEEPVLPSAVPGYKGPVQYDHVLATALAKNPARRYATAAAFKDALLAVTGAPVPATVSDATVVALPLRSPGAQGVGGVGSTGRPVSTAGVPTSWSPAVLAEVEHTLARHVGPLASVLVRRTARECSDLPSLYAKLAEQVSNPTARGEFLAHSNRHSQGSGHKGTGGSLGPGSQGAGAHVTHLNAGNSAGRTQVSETLAAQATKLLAVHVGPIASVVVKRALAKAAGRDAFVNALADAVPDTAARGKLLAELARLV